MLDFAPPFFLIVIAKYQLAPINQFAIGHIQVFAHLFKAHVVKVLHDVQNITASG
jgi:hypothetical protein